MDEVKTYESLLAELEELRMQLLEANETINAIRNGQIDALVVKNGDGHQLYTLKSADQTYRVFIEKMKEGAVTLNKNGLILYSNSQFASMVNLPLRKVIGLSFTDFVPSDSKKFFQFLFEQGWQSDSKGEIKLKNKEGKLTPFLLSFTSLNLDEGQALSLILTDLSMQKESEQQLKQKNRQLEEAKREVTEINERLEDLVAARTNELLVSREYFKFLADNIPVMVWTADKNGKLDYVNRRWIEYTGFNAEDSRLRQQVLMHPDDAERSSAAWKEALEKQKIFEQEFRFKRASDGTYRWHYAEAIPFRNEQGKVT